MRPSSLPVHAFLRPSRCAALLALAMSVMAAASGAGGAFLLVRRFFPEYAWVGMALALPLGLALFAAAWGPRGQGGRAAPYGAVAVNGEGVWLLADAQGVWREFKPARAWRTPVWITLAGRVEGASPAAPATLTIWFDAVSAAVWRGLRAALAWMQRQALAP